jgi:hypothetical protein
MAEWGSIENYLKRHYKVASQEGTWMRLNFDMGEGRSQSIMVTRAGQLIQFVSPFATLDTVTMGDVFAAMRELAIVLGITSVDGMLLVTHSQLLETADEEEIDAGIQLVLQAADLLEQRLSPYDRF